MKSRCKDDFGVEDGQVLEVAQGDGLATAGVDGRQVSADVVIVTRQVLGGFALSCRER